MYARKKRHPATRLIWSMFLGVGLILGLLWLLMLHPTAEAQTDDPPYPQGSSHRRPPFAPPDYQQPPPDVPESPETIRRHGLAPLELSILSAEEVELPARVNYAHNWIEARSLPHYTAVLTVADSYGVKATLTILADDEGRIESWEDDAVWVPNHPDIEPNDIITVSSIGYYGTINPIGSIEGILDIESDTIAGTIHAPWFSPRTLDVRCEVWTENGPDSIEVPGVAADGGSYACDFSGAWDIQPGQDVAVTYKEPDGSEVTNIFREPAPDMRIDKWPEGHEAAPGGPVVFTIRYQNEGGATAETVLITDTLPSNTTYITDSSGVPANVGPTMVTWDVGPVAAGDGGLFQVVLDNTASPSDTLNNEVEIATRYDYDYWDNYAAADIHIGEGQPDLYVNKGRWPHDPVPGETFFYGINYGNDGPVASGLATITDTLPENTSLLSWYSVNGYNLWHERSTSGDQLVLEAPAIPGYWGDYIVLQLRVDTGLSPGTLLTNVVEITTTDDSNLNNNEDTHNDTWIGSPRWDLYLDKFWGWGQLVPRGEIAYNLNYANDGNMPTRAWLTDTLPAGTTFITSNYWNGYTHIPVEPSHTADDMIVWDLGILEPGEWGYFDLRLAISPTVAPNTVITNCAVIGMPHTDSWPYNNSECVTKTVRAVGPNLRVSKRAWWENEEQIRYEIRLENIGGTRMENIWVTDIYPANTTLANWWVQWGPWVTATHEAANRQIVFWIEEINAGDTAGIGLQVDLDESIHGEQGLIFTNTAEAPWEGDVYPDDNHDTELVYTGPDVYIKKWLSGGEVEPGEIVTFTVKFGNRNHWPWEGDDEYDSHITDTLPAEMEFITATNPWDPGEPWEPETVDGHTIVWSAGPMWSDWWAQFDIVAKIADDTPWDKSSRTSSRPTATAPMTSSPTTTTTSAKLP